MRVEVRVHNAQLHNSQRTFAKEEFVEMNMSFEEDLLGVQQQEVLSITDLQFRYKKRNKGGLLPVGGGPPQ